MEQKLALHERFFGHLKTILKHKYYVFIYCCQIGIPLQGITHDMSKLSPTEFLEGVKYWNKDHSPIIDAKRDIGYSKAWFHHRNRNKHHYEYWMDNFDQGGENILMPCKYALEMIADFLAAGKIYATNNNIYEQELAWWTNRQKQPLAMHPVLQNYVTKCLKHMVKTNRTISKTTAKRFYHQAVRNYLRKE